MSKGPIVYIVDDDDGSLRSVSTLVSQMGLRTQSYASAIEFLADYKGERPGCLLTDHRMPGMTGVDLVDTLRSEGVSLAAVIMTGYAEIQLAVRAVRCGALSVVEKPFSQMTLRTAIKEAIEEDRATLAGELKVQEIEALFDSLTPEEMEVVKRIVLGHSNKSVAAELDVSIRTIESRRSKAFEKMKVTSVAELVKLTMIAQPELCLVGSDLESVKVLR